MEEVAIFLRQLGGGPGADPANAVPRFVIPAALWSILALLAWRRWRAERAERDGLMAFAASVGALRELLMLVAEYGSHRGLFDFSNIVTVYPPFEHALELLVEVLAGYAFVAAFRGRGRAIRAYLWTGLVAVAAFYAVSAPVWAALVHDLAPAAGPRPEFAQHPADLAFRILAVVALAPVVAALLLVRGRGAVPKVAAAAFMGFLLDHALMVVNIGTGLRHAPLLAPIRHNLHMWAVAVLLAIYWIEAAEALRRGERQLLRSQKLESLGLLAGGIAHDFSNLLTIVQGNLEHAHELMPPGTPREAVTDALVAADRGKELTRQLLAYTGRGGTHVLSVRVEQLAAETAQLVRSSVPPGCELDLQLPERLPAVTADATQLRQVLMNLLLNACQAMKDRPGRLAVRAGVQDHAGGELKGAAETDALPPGRYVWVEVSDEGVGMDEVTRARIFDPFFSTRPDGRGLGLAVVLGIVRAHRGALTVRSRPGAGTAFRVLLPVGAPDPIARAPALALAADNEE